METPARNIHLAVEPQTLFILGDFQIPGQFCFQTKGIEQHIITDMDPQITQDRNTGLFLTDWL